MNEKINPDGSMVGTTFTEKFGNKNYDGGYPNTEEGETYSDYYEKVKICKERGFHLGDLSFDDWHSYCLGHPLNDECLQDEYIFE